MNEREKTPEVAKEKPTINLLTDPNGALSAMGEIEGSGWLERQKAILNEKLGEGEDETKFHYTTVRRALASLNKAQKEIQEEIEELNAKLDKVQDEEDKKFYKECIENIPSRCVGEIYGNDGWNRYSVRVDGIIEFLASSHPHFLGPRDTEKARKLGFVII